MRTKALSLSFIDSFPDNLQEGVLYVSMKYAVAAHRCACGCGKEVITPLSPTDWQLIFDGKSISLRPSVGNWSFPCRSHYWIRNSRIDWAEDMPQWKIDQGRAMDRAMKAEYYHEHVADETPAPHGQPSNHAIEEKPQATSWFAQVKKWFFGG